MSVAKTKGIGKGNGERKSTSAYRKAEVFSSPCSRCSTLDDLCIKVRFAERAIYDEFMKTVSGRRSVDFHILLTWIHKNY